jgi:3-hydroxyacyl-CoA dehydrogenase
METLTSTIRGTARVRFLKQMCDAGYLGRKTGQGFLGTIRGHNNPQAVWRRSCKEKSVSRKTAIAVDWREAAGGPCILNET